MFTDKTKNEIRKLLLAWKGYFADSISFAIKTSKRQTSGRLITVVLLATLMIWLVKNKVYAQGSNLLGDESYYFSFGRIISWIMGGGLLGIILRFARREYVKIKRFIDLTASSILLIMCAPLFIIIALLVKIDSEGPVFFRQVRLGRDGNKFGMFKFRTMRENAELGTGPVWADDGDPRVTKIGYFLRKSHLDELPQLINVFRGEMSLIGPRPERPEMAELIANHVPAFKNRLNIRPGITGLAQVRYSYGASIKDAARKLKYDIIYMKRACFLLDTQIILWTVARVATGEGAR